MRVAFRLLCAMPLAFAVAAAQPPRGRGEQRPLPPPGSEGRARLENEIRRVFTRAVRQRVGLNDAQMAQLGPVTERFEQQRRQLQTEERDTRTALRMSLRDDAKPDAAKVEGLLQKMIDLQKRRVQLLEAEQRDLAAIMTPVQRAKYMGLQEQIRRRVDEMRQRRMRLFEGDMPGPRRLP